MALKDFEKAMNIFEQLSKDVNSPYRREAYSSIARIYEMMDKKKEAAQAYKQYLKVFPEAPDADFVKAKISQLLAQG
jgi:tetratricopeptide (TPR) repeat protein